jgi:hypothetical protein
MATSFLVAFNQIFSRGGIGMKKVLVLFVLFGLLSVVTPVFAADVDGVWLLQTNPSALTGDDALVTIRANGGFIFVSFMPLEMNDYIPLFGSFDGTTGTVTELFNQRTFNPNNQPITEPESLTVTFTLTSPTTAKVTITSCTDFSDIVAKGESSCAPTGTTFTIVKIF